MSLLDATRQETAKQRALRIPLDYAYKTHWVAQWKVGVTVIASLIALAYCVWAGLSPDGTGQLSPGTVVGAHSHLENNCEACHTPGVPLRGDADGTLMLSGFLNQSGSFDPHEGDKKCQFCHAGPAHHPLQIAGEVETCAACHRDHQGVSADINRVAERQCTRCHADIKSHLNADELAKLTSAGSPMSERVQNVNSFQSHPPFASVKGTDPGNIRFSHQLHMLPGQAAEKALPAMKKKLTDLPEEFRARYQATDGLVQLQCGDCHQADATNADGSPAVPSAGAYMQPIVFEQHCQACHPLRVTVTTAEGQPVDRQVPHGLQGNELRAAIAALGVLTKSTPLSPSNPVPANGEAQPPREVPGQPFFALKVAQEDKSFDNVDDVLAALRGSTCAECHGPPATAANSNQPADRDILPANLPRVWFTNSRFDHSAHRAVKCEECHSGAFATPDSNAPPTQWLDHDKILVPGLENCQQCHAPGKARFDCAECHRYHDIDQFPLGKGAPARGVQERKTTEEFLHASPLKPVTPAKLPKQEGA